MDESESGHIVRHLEKALSDDDFAWSLILVGEDQTDKLAMLTAELRGPESETGDGKRIPSGLAYWGVVPTIAWFSACADPFYLVMKAGSETFVRRWQPIRDRLRLDGYHFVSLGIGTGQKDRIMLQDMRSTKPSLYYLPVDLSTEMLRAGIQDPVRSGFPMSHILPIQLDFSILDNMEELGEFMARLVGPDPILYGLTGNTLANFEDDRELLSTINKALRPQDRLLLEVATTSKLDDEAAREAADEYHQTRAFTEFVTSALRHNTDLKVSHESVKFWGGVESGALLVKIVYQNDLDEEIRVGLPDHTDLTLPPMDTIRLYTTRKYSAERLDHMIRSCELQVVESAHSLFRQARKSFHFGVDLMLLAPKSAKLDDPRNLADDMWARP